MQEIFEAFLDWSVRFAPRPIRIAITVLLVLAAIALLTLALWWPR